MRIKGKLFIFMLALFLFFSLSVWFYTEILFDKVNEKWAERFIKKQIIFDKNRTLLPLLQEHEIIQEMANEPAILAMALDDTNESKRKNGLAILESYRQKFQSKSYFAAFVKSENYYFNDAKNSYAGKELQYKLSPASKNDAWFYNVIADNQAYRINVDTDEVLKHTYIWLNYDVVIHNKVVGVVGTGLDFTRFVRESVGVEQEGIQNFFINRYLDIQLERSTKLSDYLSHKNTTGTYQKIDTLFVRQQDKDAIREAVSYLSTHPDEIRTIWVEYGDVKKLLGLTYLHEIDWFSLTLIDAKELDAVKDFSIFPLLSALFLIALIAVGYQLRTLILNPLNRLKTNMQAIEHGHYEIDLHPVGSAEIKDLSQQFSTMIEYVRSNNRALEEKIQERTLGLMQSEAKLNTILESLEAFIYIKDTQYRYIYANRKHCDLIEVVGKTDEDFFDEPTIQALRKADREVIEYGRKVTIEEHLTSKHTERAITCLSTKIPLLREDGSVYALCGISTDITERKKTEELIRELAYHDSLTQLPNRRLFHERFTMMLSHAKRIKQYGALLVLDLDNFKPLNDAFGHKAGDVLLIDVAKRLKTCVRDVDVVARFGGDEFLIAVENLSLEEYIAQEEAIKIASSILLHVSAPYVIALQEEEDEKVIHHQCTASIGITLFSDKKQHQETIFSEADKAMYQAKQKGRNCIEFYKENV
ncbi:diguanylate cyclase domain-containing protein [Sulfurospirillum diekertiae]|uniref:Diguanylate cyclase n=1 Tax=Sulfurospirillum diekertiae TaxID=1854492 RepID=A0AA92FGB4_9BACT|nr:diguanylate cyclase [Sulfurospirillum diekertiae]QIR75648.1 diguanylate cyclase [Sulfurospirillum diekertiae]